MMQRFNKLPERPKKKTSWFGREKQLEQTSESVQPLIYATYQAYLRRCVLTTRMMILGSNLRCTSFSTPEYLAQSIAAARGGG